MNQGKISVRYSKALFETAVEKNVLDKINQDMKYISEMCSFPQVKELLANPVIVPSRKREILHNIFGKEMHPLTLSLIDLIVRNGRDTSLPAIARVFINDTMRQYGITEAMLTTAVKVAPEVRKKIVSIISDLFRTKVELKENIDDKILGGFILRVEDNYFDASVRNKLRKIRKELGATASGKEK